MASYSPNPGQMTTFQNEVTLPEMVDLVRREWVTYREDVPRNAATMFMSRDIGSGQGSTKLFEEADTETYADVKLEGANAKKSKVGVGYNILMTARTFAKQVDVTLELRNDRRYEEVFQYFTNLTRFIDNRLDLDLTHRLTFGTSTAYTDRNGYSVDVTVGDGLALFSSVHTLAFSSTTYSNLVTGNPVFSEGAYESAMLLAKTNIFSNFGEKRVMNFNTIWSGDHPATVRQIKQLLESMADVDAVQAGIKNVYNGQMRHVMLPNLATTAAGAPDSTKFRWWGVAAIDSINGWQSYYGWWIYPQLRQPSAGNNGEDINSINWTWTTYGRYGIAILSGRGIVASTPTS